MMNIYKLQYEDKKSAINDLIDKKVIDKDNNYINGTQAVVEVGKIVLVEGVYDEKNNLITEPIFLDGYHYDIMISCYSKWFYRVCC